MRQRVAIAMALSCDPDVLVADEPTTSLDATVQAQILQLLRDLKNERGLSVLLITHDMGVVASIADRVAVMYGGRIVETGLAAAILADPQHPYTRGLIASVPTLRGDVPPAPIRGEPGSVPPERRGCLFAPRCALYQPGPCDEDQRRVVPGVAHVAACWRTTQSAPAEATA
jgi:peptide/nickel transport system ATP-binding protein/oligopeptide transport system ATP-binding protein